jgi:nucleoside-diphosphate-sugar epimerase
MRVLVTGASGFIGSRVVERLSKISAFNITATGRSLHCPVLLPDNVRYLSIDLSQTVPPLHFDACIHCAGLAADHADMKSLHLANVRATENLFVALTDCKVFVHISSSSVYHFADQNAKSEADAHIHPFLSVYGKSKLEAEQTLAHCHVPSVYVLRPRAVYGRGDRHLLPRICKLVKANRLFLPGELNVSTSLTHIENLNETILAALHQQRMGTHIYNVCDAQTYQMRDVFEQIAFWCTQGQLKSTHIIPAFLLRSVVFLSRYWSALTAKPPLLTAQSLDYLQFSSRLDISLVQRELGVRLMHRFSPQAFSE